MINTDIPELVFDIPQGIYNELDISFETFDYNDDITIQVDGIYTNTSGTEYPLRFEFLSSEYFSISSEDGTGEETIVLDKDVSATSLIQFAPIYWFGNISNNKFNNADKCMWSNDNIN